MSVSSNKKSQKHNGKPAAISNNKGMKVSSILLIVALGLIVITLGLLYIFRPEVETGSVTAPVTDGTVKVTKGSDLNNDNNVVSDTTIGIEPITDYNDTVYEEPEELTPQQIEESTLRSWYGNYFKVDEPFNKGVILVTWNPMGNEPTDLIAAYLDKSMAQYYRPIEINQFEGVAVYNLSKVKQGAYVIACSTDMEDDTLSNVNCYIVPEDTYKNILLDYENQDITVMRSHGDPNHMEEEIDYSLHKTLAECINSTLNGKEVSFELIDIGLTRDQFKKNISTSARKGELVLTVME